MSKRGMSSVIVVVMIVLLVIMSVSIIWKFVSPMFGEELEVLEEVVDMRLVADEGYTSWDVANRLVEVQVMRGVDDIEIVGFGLLFTIDGDTVTHYVDEVLGFNMKKTYYINLSNYSGELESIGLVPVFLGGRIGEVISELKYYNIVGSELGGLSPEGGFVAPTSSVPGGGGGGSSTTTPVVEEPVVNCTENWLCSDWSDCVGDLRTRTCSDANSCGTVVDRPALSEGCSSVECVVDEDCGAGEYCNSGNCVPVGSECSEDSDCVYRGPGFVCNSGNECEWDAPIGIPVPSFGIEEDYRMYDNVSNRNPALTYTENSEGGFYTHYVDNSGGCSDSGDGTEGLPRCTIPTGLVEGSVVEVHSSVNPNGFGYCLIHGVGTLEKPIFVRGVEMPRMEFKGELGYYGNAKYIIVEGMSFFKGGIYGRQEGSVFNNSYISIRNCDFHGDESSGGTGAGSWTSNSVDNIVYYNNTIHDNGEWDPLTATGDQDQHGISVGAKVSYVWIVDNEMYHNSGDGLQINAGSITLQNTTHNIYVGRNRAHHNKQSGVWTKQAVDVIFSQNKLYGHRHSSSSPGVGTGFQLAPENVWFLFNEIYDNEFGINVGSNSGMGFGTKSYFIGNLIYDIHFDPLYHDGGWSDYNPGTAWAQAGIMTAGGVDRYFIGNTIYDVQAGINVPGSGSAYFANNIISNISGSGGESHIWVEDSGGGVVWEANNNLIYQLGASGRIRHYNTVYNASSVPIGNGVDNLDGDPQFVDADNGNFDLQVGSPAIDSGIEADVYQTFYDLYGINISVDYLGNERPQGSGWDIGAYEY